MLGIGINVGQGPEDFSPEVREMATSLFQVLGRPVSRPRLAAALLEELDRAYAALLAGDLSAYRAAYRRRCVNLGKTVQLPSRDCGAIRNKNLRPRRADGARGACRL